MDAFHPIKCGGSASDRRKQTRAQKRFYQWVCTYANDGPELEGIEGRERAVAEEFIRSGQKLIGRMNPRLRRTMLRDLQEYLRQARRNIGKATHLTNGGGPGDSTPAATA
jgi:hypothetical protein